MRVLAAAPSPTSEDACTPEDVGCTWETLEREVSEELVMNVMSKSVTVCHPDASVLDALEILVKNRISGGVRTDDATDVHAACASSEPSRRPFLFPSSSDRSNAPLVRASRRCAARGARQCSVLGRWTGGAPGGGGACVTSCVHSSERGAARVVRVEP